jgi:hypothetical protein
MRELVVKIAEFFGMYEFLMKIGNRIEKKRQNKAFAKYGLDALREAVMAAQESGGRLFLAFGSLLGAYREKGFIPFDFDLDTGMMAEERTEDLYAAMLRHGFTMVRQYYIKETGRVCEDKFNYKGVSIDIHYFYHNGNGELFCELCLPHESKPWREANKTDGFPALVRTLCDSPLSQHDFLGVPVFLPDRTEDWLRTLYGPDFMTPNPKWSMDDHKKRSVISEERMYRRSC